ncbi:unnamed protein product [Protopolystoma xenopodis]|uniref:Uncharacterized protein n=1 Tax=Protopolystoma xenopodis TaxID=117903 RepID=A0A3S5BTF4_9PLAT|nr:unnamed protein product [Protopolystoma xenopodis]
MGLSQPGLINILIKFHKKDANGDLNRSDMAHQTGTTEFQVHIQPDHWVVLEANCQPSNSQFRMPELSHLDGVPTGNIPGIDVRLNDERTRGLLETNGPASLTRRGRHPAIAKPRGNQLQQLYPQRQPMLLPHQATHLYVGPEGAVISAAGGPIGMSGKLLMPHVKV